MNGMTTVNEELDSIKKEVAKTSFQAWQNEINHNITQLEQPVSEPRHEPCTWLKSRSANYLAHHLVLNQSNQLWENNMEIFLSCQLKRMDELDLQVCSTSVVKARNNVGESEANWSKNGTVAGRSAFSPSTSCLSGCRLHCAYQ
jgi:hypothetical protein